MELQSLDVPVSHRVHLEVWLVAHHVIHILQVSGRSVGERAPIETIACNTHVAPSHSNSSRGSVEVVITKPGRKCWSL